jgi:WD40 repeat protein
MINRKSLGYLLTIAFAGSIGVNTQAVLARTTSPVGNVPGGALLPTGQYITPAAAPGSTFAPLKTDLRKDDNADAAEAVSTALSPDGKTLLVLTSGYNQNFKTESGSSLTYPVLDPTTGKPSTVTTSKAEWVFVFDVSSGKLVKRQQINIPNTYNGLTWSPDGQRFYVSGGIEDRIYVYTLSGCLMVLMGRSPN